MSMFQKAVRPGRGANRRSPIEERFFAKVEPGDFGCWIWTAHRQPNGYGQFSENKVVVYAHRWAYERFIGPIPAGLHLDHLCGNGHLGCVKPWHCEPVTQAENNRRSWLARRAAAS